MTRSSVPAFWRMYAISRGTRGGYRCAIELPQVERQTDKIAANVALRDVIFTDHAGRQRDSLGRLAVRHGGVSVPLVKLRRHLRIAGHLAGEDK